MNTVIEEKKDTSSSSSSYDDYYDDYYNDYYDDYYDDYPTNPSESGTSNQTDTTEPDVIADMFLSIYVNNKNDGLHVTHLLNDNYVDKGQTASKKGNNLRLEYLVDEHSCGDKAPDGSPCPTRLTDKYYTLWEPATFSEAMLTANPISAEDTLKGKIFSDKKEYVAGDTYDYFAFSEDGSAYDANVLEYWGNNIFFATKTITGLSGNSWDVITGNPWIVSEKNKKYYLRIKGDQSLYYFEEAAEGSEQDFSDFYCSNYAGDKVSYTPIKLH